MLIKIFEEQAGKEPGKIAVKSGEYTLTYGYLSHASSNLAQHIINRYRTVEYDGKFLKSTVALLLGHDESMILAMIGALKANRIYIPFDPVYPQDRLLYMLKDSNTGMIITNSENIELAVKLANRLEIHITVININEPTEHSPVENLDLIEDEEQIAYILYTSGSTGWPKGVIQTRPNIVYFIRNWCRRFSITSSDRMALFASYCHDGAIPDIFSSLLSGATLYPFDIKRNLDITNPTDWLNKEKITIWHSVPTWYRYFVNVLTGCETFSNLRFIILGGEPVREHDLAMFKKYFPQARFGNIYGQTESTVTSIWIFSPREKFEKISIGESIDATELFLVDDKGEEVEELEVGEIVAASRHLSPGYLNNPDATHRAYSQDGKLGRLYWTGDQGRLMPEGNSEILGRKDHQVKVRGFRIEPGEIESTLLRHPDIREAVVLAREAQAGNTYGSVSGDHLLWAYLVTDREFIISELREYTAGKLPDYMIPTYFVKLETMPVTPTGKIDRKVLAGMGTRLGIGEAYTPPQTEIETILTETWQEILNLERIGIHDNFFDLGGNSMDAIYFNKKLKEKLNLDIPVTTIYRYLTIKAFAGYLTQQEANTEAFEKRIDRSEQLQIRKQRLKNKFRRIGGKND